MAIELVGVPLGRFENPIREALTTYQEISDNGLVFNGDNACKLILTPDKPNSARSSTDTFLNQELVGKLYVIAFKPGDGTGSQEFYRLDDLKITPPYPTAVRVIPRDKVGVHSETHLTLMRHVIEDSHAEPELYAGTFDLLGLRGNSVIKIGELGHPEGVEIVTPITTFTVGYRGTERFGDPHAVFSRASGVIQVCAFLAISDDVYKNHPNIWDGLKPQFPRKQ